MAIAVNREIISRIYPVRDNKYGWALDCLKCFVAEKLGFTVMIDKSIELFHPESFSYGRSEANEDMAQFIHGRGWEFERFCRETGSMPLLLRWFYKSLNLIKGEGFKL